LNLSWKCLPETIQLKEWFHSADGCYSFAKNNVHKKIGKFQSGGTFWIATGHATSHVLKSNQDPLKLGRWVSCSLKGRSGKGLFIIFAYCPCSNSATWIHSIYTQHCCYLDSINWSTCPCTAFLEDLASFITTH